MPKKQPPEDLNMEFDAEPNSPVRVATLGMSPSVNDLYQVLEFAKSELGRKFELVWSGDGSATSYTLSVSCPSDQGIPPDWSLIMPDGSSAWSYLGDDVALIQLHVRNISSGTDTTTSTPAFPDFSFHSPAAVADPFPFGEVGKIATVEFIDTEPFVAPMARDFATLRQYHEMLLQPETGILSQWWMMYFLEQEYYRYKACHFPFTLAVFDLTMNTPNGPAPLSLSHIKQIGQRIANAKRKIDLFGHFGTTLYALMLPHTELGAGTNVANRIKKQITTNKQEQGWDNSQIVVRSGISEIPTGAQDLNGLIVAAVAAMQMPDESSKD